MGAPGLRGSEGGAAGAAVRRDPHCAGPNAADAVYYTNLLVAKDGSSALLYDCNRMDRGYAYRDVRNVLSSLSKEAGAAFLEECGSFDEGERLLDDVLSTVVTLYLALKRESLPRWAKEEAECSPMALRGVIEHLLGQA